MSRETDFNFESDQLIPSSLLDRLMAGDASPGNRSGAASDLKSSVRRDLERMLNTRWRCVGPSPEMKELDCSLMNYGLPDCSAGGSTAGVAREELRRTIERAIQKFEPRFKSARVKLAGNIDELDRALRFRIDAVLHGNTEVVVFDSALELATSGISVKRPAR